MPLHPTPRPAWPASRLAAMALGCIPASAALMVLAAGAYTVKRRLRLDIVPGVDMLPDPRIEAAIAMALRAVGLN